MKPNVTNPTGFQEKLHEVNIALYDLFELCREEELAPYSEDGCMRYDEESGKCCFQAAGLYKRPGEFLDALLDMLRVTYEPSPLGTFFLNSNPAFIYEAIPKAPFTLGYLSVLGDPTESFSSMWDGVIATKLTENGYNLNLASALYVVVAGNKKRMGGELVGEVHEVINAGFSVDEVLGLFATELGINKIKPQKESYAGFVWDDGLDERLRVSIWLFIEGIRLSGGALFDNDPGLPKTVETQWKYSSDAGLRGFYEENTNLQFGGLFDNDLGYSVRVRRSV